MSSVNEKKQAKVSNETLMSRAASGDLPAFGELVERLQVRLRRFVFRYVRDEHTATEMAQEAFMKAYEQRRKWRPKAKFTTWLFTIARNLCIQELRRLGHRPFLESSAPGGCEDFLDTMPHQDAGPEAPIELTEEQERALGALEEMSEIYRETVILRIFESLSYSEISAVTGDPVGRLRVRMCEALKRLRKKLR